MRGVRRHMRANEAREVCPEIVLVQVPASHSKADISIYRNASQRVLSVLMSAADGACERASIDEVYVDLTDAAQRLIDECADANGPAVPQPVSFDSMFVSSLEACTSPPPSSSEELLSGHPKGLPRPASLEHLPSDSSPRDPRGRLEERGVCDLPDSARGASPDSDASRHLGFAEQGDTFSFVDPPSPSAGFGPCLDDESEDADEDTQSYARDADSQSANLEADDVSRSLERARGDFAAGAPPIVPKECFVAASGWYARPPEEWLPGEALLAAAAILASRIRRAVWEKLGFTCSTGIGPTKLLAKVASAAHKPGGQTIVTASAAAEALAPMPMRSLRGLGGKMGRYIAEQTGIETVGDLARMPPPRLASLVGEKESIRLLGLAVGVDRASVVDRRVVRDISWGKSFRGRAGLCDRAQVDLWLQRLSAGLSERLQEDEAVNPRVASSLTLSWSLRRLGEEDRHGGFTSRSSSLGRRDANSILSVARSLANRVLPWKHIGKELAISGLYLKAGRFLDTGGSASIRTFFGAQTASDDDTTVGDASASGGSRVESADADQSGRIRGDGCGVESSRNAAGREGIREVRDRKERHNDNAPSALSSGEAKPNGILRYVARGSDEPMREELCGVSCMVDGNVSGGASISDPPRVPSPTRPRGLDAFVRPPGDASTPSASSASSTLALVSVSAERAGFGSRRVSEPPPDGVDPEAWAALPREIRSELITQAKFASMADRRRVAATIPAKKPERKKHKAQPDLWGALEPKR